MEQYIIIYSKYVIAALTVIYTLLSCLRAAGRRRSRKGIDNVLSILIFLIQFAAFLTMCLEKGSVDYLFFYAFSQIALFASMALFLMLFPEMDRLLLNNMCLLLGTGFIMLARLDLAKAGRQLIIAAFSLGISMAVPFLMHKWEEFLPGLTWVYLGTGAAVLSAVLLLGEVTRGSRLTFSLAGFSFQPSEFVKLLFVFGIAAMLWEDASLKRVALCGAAAAVHVLILALSRDLGSALIFYIAFVFLVFLASGKAVYLFLGGAGGAAASWAAYRLFSHVRVRLQAWRDPWSVIDDEGFQITQSLFALSRGSWFGLGIGQGTPKDIPFVETDFIFAAVTEEMGLLFSVCLLTVCLTCFLVFLRTAWEEEDRFYGLTAAGLGVVYIFQTFLTVGGGTKFIPLTGVTLPFVSYGGSSILASCLLFAVVQAIRIRCRKERERRNGSHNRRSDWEEEDDWTEETYGYDEEEPCRE